MGDAMRQKLHLSLQLNRVQLTERAEAPPQKIITANTELYSPELFQMTLCIFTCKVHI